MGEHAEAFVGIDAAKARDAIAVAEGGRGGEVRYLGEVDASERICCVERRPASG
jgi:transposase